MKRYSIVLLLAAAVLLLIAFFMPDSVSTNSAVSRKLKPVYTVTPPKATALKPTAKAVQALKPAETPPLKLDTVKDQVFTKVFEEIAPESRVIQCESAKSLEEGVYRLLPPLAGHYAIARNHILTIAVTGKTGSAVVEQDLQVLGEVSWLDNTCSFSATQLVTLRGELLHADGKPAVDYEIRGCKHGSFARTNAAGEWEMQGVAGTTCSPMAFVEVDDGSFGKSNVVYVEVTAPGPVEGISIRLPAPEQLWNEKQLGKMAATLSAMIDPQLEEQEERLEAAQSAMEICSNPSSCAVLQQIVHNEQMRADAMREQTERLDDTDEQNVALMEMWLNLY